MAKMDPVGFAEVVDPNKFITFSDMLRAAASTAGPTRRGPASSWDVPQAMSEPVIGQRPTPNMPAALRDAFVSRPVEVDPTQFRNAREPQPGTGFGPPEATNMRANINQSGPIGALQSLINGLTTRGPETLGPNAPPSTVATRISNASMRAAAGNGVVPNANVSGTYTPPDPTNLDIYGPGIVLPGGNVLGGIPAEERTPRRPETLPLYSAPAPAAATAPRGNGIVPNADVAGTYMPPAPKAGDVVGSPIEIMRGLQRTSYLPVMDAQGRVSYQSEDFMKQKAAEQTAAKLATAKTTAEIDKLLGEGQKARTPAADQRMVNTYLDTLEKYLAPRLQSPDAEVRAKAVEEYLSNMEGLISKFGIESTLRRQMAQKLED